MIIYPVQANNENDDGYHSYTNPSLMGSIEKLDEIGQSIAKLFRGA